MKRILAVLLALLCLTLAFTSCGNKKHKPKVVEVVEPTCMAMGYTEYTCKHCGDYVADFTDALGHAYGEAVAISEETCTSRGLYESTCVRCGELHKYSTNAKGHSYVEISENDETVAYECETCHDIITLASDERIEDYVGRVELFDVEPYFSFNVISTEGEAHIRDNLMIIDSYFHGSEYENDSDVAKEYVLSNASGNVWTVTVLDVYEYDTTYLAKLTGGVKLADYKGNELSFTVVDDPNHENAYEYNDSAVFLKALENANGGYYPYQISAEGGYLYLTVGKLDGISRGQLLCVGEVSSIYEINSNTECYFGIVEATYQLAEGRYMVKLAEPAIETIFNQFDIAYNQDINLDGADVNVEQVKADIVNSLYANEEFLEFLSAVHMSTSDYLEDKNCYSPELLDGAAFLNSVKVNPTVSFSGNTLHTTLAGEITLSIKNSSGSEVGTLTIDFTFDIESQFKIDVKYEVQTGWKGITIQRFDVAMTQNDNIGFNFGITVDADTLVNDAEYVLNLTTGEAHLACCIEVTRAEEGAKFAAISASEAQSANKKCAHCRPEGGDSLADDFKGYYIETLYCSDWERVCADINKLLEANGADVGTTVKLGGVKIPVFGPVSVNLDLGFAISFDARAIMDYSCSFTQTSTYGMRLNHSYIQPYSQISGGTVTENELAILGAAEVKAGLAVDAYVNISGLEKWINAGVRAEVGAYSDISGVLDSANGISGAYLETGVYLDISAYYKLVKNDGSADIAEMKNPLEKFGYQKLYFGYETYYDGLEILGSFDIAANDILNVKYYDLVNMTIKTDELSLNERSKYRVTLSLASGEHCEIKDGVIVYKLGAPKVFSDTLIITVEANNGGFGQYRRGSALYYIDTVEIDFTFDTNHTHTWQEATCTTARTCTGCGLKEGEALGHNFSEATCTTPQTCVSCGETKGMPIAHTESDWIIDSEPTDDEYGSKHKECTVCGYIITTVAIKPSASQGLKFSINEDGVSYSVTGIGTCTDKDIVIPYTYNGLPVTAIGDYAFKGLNSLTSVDIPDSVTSIGYDAFKNCSSLTSVTIGNSVTSIGYYAFANCDALTSIEIPDSVTEIGGYAFCDCDALTSIEIPDSVTSIGYHAFSSCDALASVTIGNSVTSIGNDAFKNCSSLTSVTIGNSVTSIGYEAFYYCSALTDVTIGNSVNSIGEYAFLSCTSLTSVTIGNSVTSIGDGAFRNCTSLTSIEVDENNVYYQSIDGNLYTKDGKTLICYATGKQDLTFTIPNGVTSISNYAFEYCNWLTSIEIPDTVTSIGYDAFFSASLKTIIFNGEIPTYPYSEIRNLTNIVINEGATIIPGGIFSDCDSLESISIPNSVTSIGSYAFENCPSLTSIEIPDSVTSIGYRAFEYCKSLASVTISKSLTEIDDCVFYDCSSLTSITIPDSVTSIDYSAFSGCISLASITIPDSVTSIGYDAFKNCTSLTSVTIGNSLKSMEWAFSGCTSLKTIIFNGEIPTYPYSEIRNLTNIVINEGATIIPNSAFSNCASLESINIPNSVTSIGNEAFYTCYRLTSIAIPDSITTIGDYAFWNCASLASVTIGNSVTSIGEGAFDYCRALASVTIPDSVTSIAYSPFSYCESLTSIEVDENNVYYQSIDGNLYTKDGKTLIRYAEGKQDLTFTIPNGVISIADGAFISDNSLASIIIPDSVTSIGKAFSESALTSITIPDSVTSIGSSAFKDCYSLASITIPDSVTSIGDYACYMCKSLTSVTIPDSVTSIGSSAFQDCYSLTSITIPDSVTSIGYDAFRSCESLTSVTIPDSVTSIGSNTFSYCKSLTSVTIGNSVTSIGNGAFSSCTSLVSVVIPDSVTSIGDHAFSGCRSLTSIIIPDSVTSVGGWAFSTCTSLTIYCEATSQPSGWVSDWNYSNRPVVWGYKITE